jgi:hypothetical protein
MIVWMKKTLHIDEHLLPEARTASGMAIAYFALGDNDRGFEWLTKAFDQRSGFISAANVNPGFDGVRDDPRFKALVSRLQLPK